MLWNDGSFQIIAGMLSRPGVLLVLIDFTVTWSSVRVNGSELMSSGSNICVNGIVEFSSAGGG